MQIYPIWYFQAAPSPPRAKMGDGSTPHKAKTSDRALPHPVQVAIPLPKSFPHATAHAYTARPALHSVPPPSGSRVHAGKEQGMVCCIFMTVRMAHRSSLKHGKGLLPSSPPHKQNTTSQPSKNPLNGDLTPVNLG